MEELISKKELLEKYGISYGALYRWKRMGLIPEEWFEKKSAVTGQETYFPREAVCERIEMILEKKDSMSLENIAEEIKGNSQELPRVLRIVWDGGTTQIPLSKIHSIVVVDQNEDSADIVADLSSVLGKTADISVDTEAIVSKVRDKIEKTSEKIRRAGASIDGISHDLEEKLLRISETINEMFNQKGNE
ncbi:MAG: DUF4004 family protein [Ruminococcaceae bacterium]|nr:DUF4004 family protein [Oscillospiraceae bacterium]